MTKKETEKYEYDEKTALAKISVLIKKHYENIGRIGGEETDLDEARQELLDDIEEILNQTPISQKHLIIERLESDNEVDENIKKSLKSIWKN